MGVGAGAGVGLAVPPPFPPLPGARLARAAGAAGLAARPGARSRTAFPEPPVTGVSSVADGSVVVGGRLAVALGLAVGDPLLEDRARLDDEVVPDLRRERAAGHRLAVELGLHRRELVRVADPDGDRHLLGEADEPGVAEVLRRAGLAGREARRTPRACPCRSTRRSASAASSARRACRRGRACVLT